MQYRELFSLTVENPYYSGMESADFTLEPSAECEQWLRNYRLYVKHHPAGLKVFMPVNAQGVNPLLPLASDVRFDFWMRLRNPDLPLFTDLEKTYDERPIVNPIFTNEGTEELTDGELGKRIRLKAKELETMHTDAFRVPDTLPPGETDIPFILKHNPRPPIDELFVYIPQGGASAAAIKDAWTAFLEQEGNTTDVTKGFQLEQMLDGKDPIRESGYEKPLIPYELKLSPAGSESGVRVSYNWGRPAPRLSLKVADSGVDSTLFQEANSKRATFEIFPEQNLLKIYIANTNITFQELAHAWRHWEGKNNTHHLGFRIERLGDGSGKVLNLGLGNLSSARVLPLEKAETPELIWPREGHRGMKVLYSGGLPGSRIRITEVEDGPGGEKSAIVFVPVGGLDVFSITGNTHLEITGFSSLANVVRVNPHGEMGVTFQLHYPAQPQLPWGVFGKVEIHAGRHFNMAPSEGAPENRFVVHFFNTHYYWKGLLLVEDKEHDPGNKVNSSFKIIDPRPALADVDPRPAPANDFFSYELTGKNRDGSGKTTFLTNAPKKVLAEERELSGLWDNAWHIIDKEKEKGKITPKTRYFLFISKGQKIGKQPESLQHIQLKRDITTKAPAQDSNEEKETTSSEEIISHLPAPELLNNWLHVIDLRVPEFAKKFKE
ncbi:MAG: hypothetical protein H6558_22825 [Lewinellaceae bacterium]|nr:hypothetical protein [Lewinellaceae bacterium]